MLRRRPRLVAAGVVVIVVVAVVATLTSLGGNGSNANAVNTSGTRTATVHVTDLAQTTPVSGTIGFASGYTIVEPGGDPAAAVQHDQQAVSSAQAAVSSDQASQAGTTAGDRQAVAQDQADVQGDQSALASDQAGLANDRSTLAADQQKEANDCQGAASAGSSSDAGGPGGSGSGSGGSGGSGGGAAGSGCAADQSRVSADQTRVDQDQQTVTKDQQQLSSAEAQLASAQQKVGQDQQQSGAKLTADQQSLAAAQQTLSGDSSVAAAYGPNSKYTSLPTVGQVISPGRSLWSVDGQAVVLLPGLLTPWRAFTSGMTAGPDVAVLNQALASLGFGPGLGGSDAFGSGTAAAIDRLQASAGVAQTGQLLLGAAVFSPTPLRVTAVHPMVGSGVAGGQPVLDVTSTTPVINVALPVTQSYLVKVGDQVSADLPDGSSAAGTITAVGTVATSTSGSGGGNGNGNGNGQPSATIDVTVALSHASPAGSLDQAPVTVNITNQSATNVLAVPTTALLALAGGGYALEVVEASGAHHLEAVTTGIFDDQSGLVQVSGPGVAAGQKVVIPAS